VGPLSLCFPLGGKGRRFFSGILILPRLIKSAKASRMSFIKLETFPRGFLHQGLLRHSENDTEGAWRNQIPDNYGKRSLSFSLIESFLTWPLAFSIWSSSHNAPPSQSGNSLGDRGAQTRLACIGVLTTSGDTVLNRTLFAAYSAPTPCSQPASAISTARPTVRSRRRSVDPRKPPTTVAASHPGGLLRFYLPYASAIR